MSEVLGVLDNKKNLNYKNIFKNNISIINDNFENHKLINFNNLDLIFPKDNNNILDSNLILINVYGKIYNHDEISNEFNWHPTKTLINLYKNFGINKMLNKLNGDFIIFIYDKIQNSLTIARDRFGLRPIFYMFFDGAFIFSTRSSMINQLTNNFELDKDFIRRYAGYHYRYIDNEPTKSAYRQVKQIPASHYIDIRINFDNKFNLNDLTKKQYWYLEDNTYENYNSSIDTLSEQYRELIFDSVKIRLNNTENPAFTLSGGMDSSTILANAVKNINKKLPAFSTVYNDKTYDETEEISSMLNNYVSKWHPIEIKEPDLDVILNKMIDANDEPIATSTWLSNFLMCEQIKSLGFKNLFGGLGGDELNAGEYEYFYYYFADLMFNEKNKTKFENEVKLWIKYHNHPIFKKDINLAKEYLSRNVDSKNLGKCIADKDRLYRYADTLVDPIFDDIEKPIMKNPYNSYLKNRTYQDIFYETVPCSIRAQYRNAKYYNIENFLPFFDHRLVEFMFKIPNNLKINNGVTKILLRKSMTNILPDETRNRIKKTGWNAPAHLWFSGSSLDFLMDLINSQKFKERGIYKVSKVREITTEHMKIINNNEIKDNHMMFLWQLVNLELWLQKNENI